MATEHQAFIARFMDDYFAECEEHLAEVRASLLVLEARLVDEAPPGSAIDDLFRSFHSLKGISAMAEMQDSERLAHELESYLRDVQSGAAGLSAEGFDALAAGTGAFEQLLAAKRRGQPPPSVAGLLDRIARLTSEARPADPREAGATPAAPASGPARLRVTFTPSPALVARGIKVDTIRERLRAIGQVERASPRVLDGGRIAFDFVVATSDAEKLRGWQADGVGVEPLDATESAADGRSAPEAAPAPATFVRMDLSRLDELMHQVGDLVLTRSRLANALGRVESHVPPAEWQRLLEHGDRLERQLRHLREGVMRARLVPVGEIFQRMPFVVRDLARDTGKVVRVELAGERTELDKLLVERMADPLLHLVRNAVSHGIEPPDERASAGKPPEGTIRLSAAAVGTAVLLDVRDDGRGLDTEAILTRARAQGLAPASAPVDDDSLLELICTPGLTTRDAADRASGRGIGMDVVRRTVRELGGSMDVESAPGRGTAFQITLPLTLAITDALLLAAAGRTFAAPLGIVREVLEVDEAQVTRLEANELLVHRGAALPLVRLHRMFGLPEPPEGRRHALVAGTGTGAFLLLVDRIEGQREIVVKAIHDPLIQVDAVSGITELGDGRVALILDLPWLAARIRERRAHWQGGRGHA